ncbi:MAG: iron-containing alcohol dehydrogenase [Clostridia bacterium]|nr:iron-containing alcohol dehydrogenase [Clostridia bacterium]
MPKYFMPTTLLSGENCIKRHPRHIIHGKKCMIVTGKNSARVSGALDDVLTVLDEHNVKYYIHDKITNKTNIADIYALGKKMRDEGIEYVVGIGGGTTLDAAKAAAVYATNDIEPMDIYKEKYANLPLRVVCVPTTAGTGSDTTQYVMLTIDDYKNKKSFSSEVCFPYATYLDSRYTLTLPVDVTRSTAIDALCHSVESYLNVNASPFSDIVALEGIRMVGQCAGALIKGEFTKSDREKLLIAASVGGMAVAHTGLNVVHKMGHQLTCDKSISHGFANGLLLTEFIAWCAKADVMRAVDVITAIGMDLSSLKKFMDKVLPSTDDISRDDIERWVKNSIYDDSEPNSPRKLTKEDELEIYTNALLNKKRNYAQW